MLVDGCQSPGAASRTPSILDSPTLARVERARLRHETGVRNSSASHYVFAQMPLTDSLGSGEGGFHAIKKGLLWQQRDRLFSRWKERYFVLTRDYLHCFKRATNRTISSDMGHFIFKIKLLDVERVEWHNKKTYSTVSLDLGSNSSGGRILLRAPPQGAIANNPNILGDGLEEWFELLEECMINSKERRKTLMNQHRNSRDNNNMNSIQSTLLDEWLLARKNLAGRSSGLSSAHCDSVPDLEEALAVKKRDRRWVPPDDDDWNSTAQSNRLSLLTDIDINASCESGTSGGDSPPSTSSTCRGHSSQGYRLNPNVFFLAASQDNRRCLDTMFQRGIAQGRSSFNSPKTSTAMPSGGRRTQEPIQHQIIKYRERSHSDIQRLDRRPWRMRPEDQQRRNSHLLEPAQG